MAVKIRLARIGKKKTPFYRIVASDARVKRDGKYIEYIGTYDGLKGSIVSFYQERYEKWLSLGAIPTPSARKIRNQFAREQKATQVV